MASEFYQIPFSIYRLNHATFSVNVISKLFGWIPNKSFWYSWNKPPLFMVFYPYDAGLNSI